MNTLKEPPFKIVIDLDRCEGIVVRENGEEITFREYIRKLVEETKGNRREERREDPSHPFADSVMMG